MKRGSTDLGARRGEVRQRRWRKTVWVSACRHLELWSTARCEATPPPSSRGKSVWNPNDPVPMEVAAVKARGEGKKEKDTSKGKGKGKSGGKSEDKGQAPKDNGETSRDDRTCYSCGRRGHMFKDCNTYGVTEVQTYPQHPHGLFPRQTHSSLVTAQNSFGHSLPSTMAVPSVASTMRAVNQIQTGQSWCLVFLVENNATIPVTVVKEACWWTAHVR